MRVSHQRICCSRPVRGRQSIRSNLEACGRRYQHRFDYRVGFDNTGALVGIDIKVYENAGCLPNEFMGLLMAFYIDNGNLLLHVIRRIWVSFKYFQNCVPKGQQPKRPYIKRAIYHKGWNLKGIYKVVNMIHISERSFVSVFMNLCISIYNILIIVKCGPL